MLIPNKVYKFLLFIILFSSISISSKLIADWYDSNITYYKITTTKDGIAKISLKQLLEIAPELSGKSQHGLHLLYKGISYPFYYNGDETINNNAEIYFYGRRASGDSTYFNHYTNEAAFFLYYDNNTTSLRLNLLEEPSNAAESINKVIYNQHLEKDITYYFGYDVLNVEADKFEKWYWQILNDYPGGKANNKISNCLFNSNFFFFPYYIIDENLKLTANISTTFTDPKPDPHYKRCIKAMLNTDTIYTYNFDSLIDNHIIEVPLKSKNLFSGINQFSIINSTADTFNTEIGVDYYEISGYGTPCAYKSESIFEIPSSPNNFEIEIPGFSSEKIVIIDTLSNFIIFKNGNKISKVHANVSGGEAPYISIMINDEIHTYNYTGFHIGILRQNNTYAEFQSSKQMGKEIENLLPSINSGSIAAIAYNGDVDIPPYLANWLASQGSTLIKNVKAGTNYICIFEVGNPASIKESIDNNGSMLKNQNKFIAANAIFNNENGKAYSINLRLPANLTKNYIIHANDSINIEIAKVSQIQKTKLQTPNNNGADMIIISHPQFYNAANKLAEYRRGQGYRIELINVDDIYKEYSYGIKNPKAIKDFLKYAYNTWKEPKIKYVLLIGDASRDPNLNDPTSVAIDYIPSYGVPVSDYWYGTLSNQNNYSELIVGRIPVSTADELMNYIDKVMTYENSLPLPWHKQFLFLNGGLNTEEQKKSILDSYYFGDYAANYPICSDTLRISKTDFVPSGESQKNEIIAAINSGQIFTVYNGHASPEVFDMDGWQAQNLNNKDKYGFLTTLSCNSGAFAEPSFTQCRNEEYLLAKDKGFVCVLGSTTVGETNSNFALFDILFNMMANNNKRNIGELLYESKNKMPILNEFTESVRNFFTILGDPLLNIHIDTIPDLYLTENDINVTVKNTNNPFIKETDSVVTISTTLYNGGTAVDMPFMVKLTHIYDNNSEEYKININSLCKKEIVNFDIPINNQSGYHQFTIEIDTEQEIIETRKNNNIISSKFYVYKSGLLPVEPLAYWNMPTSSLRFRQINQLFDQQGKYNYEFKILTINNNQDTILVKTSSTNEINEYENYVDWIPDINLEKNNNYILVSQLIDINTGNKSDYLFIPFNTYNSTVDNNTKYALKHNSELSSLELNNMMINADTSSNTSFNVTLLNNNLTYQLKAFTKDKAQRYCRIWLGDSIYVDGTGENRGFNVVIVPKNNINPVGKYYRFDTYNKPEQAKELLNLLQDSIKNNDYVIISTSDRSFNAFSKPQLDTLKSLLSSLGSQYINDVSEWSSFAMIGWKNAPKGSVPESHVNSDTASLTGNLTFYSESGECSTTNIGPAVNWNKIIINGNFNSKDVISSIEIIGVNALNENTTLMTLDTIGNIDISKIDAEKYPYLMLKFYSKRNKIDQEHYINSILFDYTPSPELAYNKISHITPNPILRADSASLLLSVSNISLRSSSINSPINIEILGLQSSTTTKVEKELPKIAPDNNIEIEGKIYTEFLDASNILKITIDNLSINKELYNFNNDLELPLTVYEDTISPTMEITIDNDIIVNKDYITDEPTIEIKLFDNSRLAITNKEPISLKINGIQQNKNNTQFYKIDLYETGNDIKAQLKIIPTKLIDKENLFIFTCVDASGNRDTSQYYLFVSLNGYINNLMTSPNPVLNENMNFNFYYIANSNSSTANIDIYNALGKKVKTIITDLKLRNNSIIWDMKDDNGILIAPGLYFYIITVNADFWVAPQSGKFIFAK